MSKLVYIAKCAEHGLHGCRTRCYECGEEAEQVPMLVLSTEDVGDLAQIADDLNEVWEVLRHIPGGSAHLGDAVLEAAQLLRPVGNGGDEGGGA